MANRDYKNRGVRSIQNSNGTYYITMPKELIGDLKWRERQKVVVEKSGKGLKITDWKK